MKKILSLTLCLSFLLSVLLISTAQAVSDDDRVRVGLFYGNSALATANLENNVGSGYRFGYYDSGDRFVPLGSTTQTQISMLKTQTIYLKGDQYYDSNPGGASAVIGCYHLQLPNTYSSFEEAQAAASDYSEGFPAWISGQFVVRVGAYESKSAAQSAQGSLGLGSASILGTTSAGINVTRTKTAKILFQFDSGQTFAVSPGTSDSAQNVTWFKGFRYYGDFLYERLGGGNLTISNFVSMDQYLKGVLPYEMSASWPLEALKAQAVCARTYTYASTGNRHSSQHFDICNTTCCQVYRGLNSAGANSDRAVEETAGICVYYQGKLAQTFYYSSNGGASEDVKNVWGSSYPYLAGVKDPYEATIEKSIQNYRWSVTYTSDQLTKLLQGKGYQCSKIVDLKVTQFTPMGNVFSIAFIDSNGKSFPFTKERVRTILGLRSMRYQVNGDSGGATSSAYYVDEGGETISDLSGQWTIGSNGNKTKLAGSDLYAITSAGTEALQGGTVSAPATSSTSASGVFTINGSGYGHHVGMSQWGAYAMAKQGSSYQDILKFYFTGIDLN